MKSHNRTVEKILLLALLIVTIAGCGGNKVVKQYKPIGSISLSILASDEFSEDKIDRFEMLNGKENIIAEIRSLFVKKKLYDYSSPLSMEIVIDEFRMRHGAMAFFFGILAGADFLGGEVKLVKDGRTIKTFHTGTGSSVGGLRAPTQVARMERLVRKFAKLVYNEYRKDPDETPD